MKLTPDHATRIRLCLSDMAWWKARVAEGLPGDPYPQQRYQMCLCNLLGEIGLL